ncbi:hypothetical protein ABZ023_09750 [Streptomyces sp. NPDC006367]|uniref:hypothetical protein n=1 Tax=unclassified Streptomyces TaxID=2593676 RepID=UPI0033A691FA
MSVLFHGGPVRERVSDRAFRVLAAMRELGSGPHALSTIVGRTTLSRSTVQRLMHSGMKNGVIWQPRHGHYALIEQPDGRKAPLGRLVPALPAAQQALGFLSERTGHCAGLHATVLTDEPVQLCVARVTAPGDAATHPVIGQPWPLEANAAGQVISAYLDRQHPHPRAGETIRLRGWAASPGPGPGTKMLAMPILRFGIPLGAMSLTGDADRLEAGLLAHVTELRRATAQLWTPEGPFGQATRLSRRNASSPGQGHRPHVPNG